jgi:inner membrane protein COX18
MCGTHSGLLGLLVTNPFTSQPSIDPDAPRDAALSSLVDSPPTASYVDPALATEGALWFPNLLLPDPHLLLPFILSGTLFLNIHLTTRRSPLAPAATPFQRRLTTTLKVVALAIGPATLNVPAGMLVYWTSSALFALGIGRGLDVWMPLRPPPRRKLSDIRDEEAIAELKRRLKTLPRIS